MIQIRLSMFVGNKNVLDAIFEFNYSILFKLFIHGFCASDLLKVYIRGFP